jgi:hypothetical protein
VGEPPFEKVLDYLECPHKYPNLPPNDFDVIVIKSPELMEWYEKVGKNKEFQRDVFDHEVCKQPMPEDEEELLKAIWGKVDKLEEDVYYALVYAVLDKVLKPLGSKDDGRHAQRSIDEILDVAREAIKVERSFMIMIPYSSMGFIRFDLPATWRGSLRRRSTWNQQRCKYPHSRTQ